jgi:hypothetical protein
MKQKKHSFRWQLILLAVVLGLLSGCHKGDDEAEATGDPGPEEYQFGDETVVALGATVEEFPVEGSYEESLVTYTYQGLSDGKAACSGYIAALTTVDEEDEDAGEPFTVVDEEMYVTTADLTEEEGTVYLARNVTVEEEEEEAEETSDEDEEEASDEDGSEASDEQAEESAEPVSEEESEAAQEENRLCVMQLDYTADSCTVTLRYQTGVIQQRPVETSESSSGGSGFTLTSAMDYIKSLDPAELGLDGTSMDEYQIYALDGIILVDGNACLHLKVYSTDNPQQTNHLEGNFLLSGDGQHLYSLDEVNGVVEVIF